MREQELQKLLKTGSVKKCVAFFRGMPESQRRCLAPLCQHWLNEVRKDAWIARSSYVLQRNPLLRSAEWAVFATGTLSDLCKLSRFAWPDDATACELLADRPSKLVGDLVLRLLSEPHYWVRWRLIRRLVNTGRATKPDHPKYYLGMISGYADDRPHSAKGRCIEKFLLADPELLEDEIWRLFEHDGDGENTLANWDRRTRGQTWCDALLRLMKAGRLPREPLVTCSLDAMQRDFNHYRAKWFATFHDALALSSEEQRTHAGHYLRLLSVSAPNIVSWALQKVEKLSKTGVYDAPALIAALPAVLESRSKTLVKKALRLLAGAAKQPEQRSQVAAIAVAAVAHEAPDVQLAALDTIDAMGVSVNGQLASRLTECRELVAPSVRSRLKRWIEPRGSGNGRFLSPTSQRGRLRGANSGRGKAGPSRCSDPRTGRSESNGTPALASLEKRHDKLDPKVRSLFAIDQIVENIKMDHIGVPAASFDGTDIARLDPNKRLAPIHKLDELIDVCARVIEDDSLVDDLERALDGLSRLCACKPDDFQRRTGALLKRAQQRKSDHGPAGHLGALVHAWCTGTVPPGRQERRGLHYRLKKNGDYGITENHARPCDFLWHRSRAIARRLAAGAPAALLSAPTHTRGWIDPRTLVQRAGDHRGPAPDLTDVCLAMLRMAPDGRGEALGQMPKASTEWRRAIRYALGARGVRIGKTPALWIAAARSRAPWSDDERVEKKFPKRGPDAGRTATYAYRRVVRRVDTYRFNVLNVGSDPVPPQNNDVHCVSVTLHALLLYGTAGWNRWLATLWPLARESYFATAVRDVGILFESWSDNSVLEPLLDPGTPLRSMGLLLLATALALKQPSDYGLATDVAIRAIEDGRLGCDNFGSILAELMPTGLIKLGRWQKTLADVARISPVHALVVQRSLQRCLQGSPGKMPRDYGKLLELLKELSIELGVPIDDEPCRALLERIKGSSKAAKTAKQLLALESHGASEAGRLLMHQALEQRRAAAQRHSSLHTVPDRKHE